MHVEIFDVGHGSAPAAWLTRPRGPLRRRVLNSMRIGAGPKFCCEKLI
jgi:hypothetical protein